MANEMSDNERQTPNDVLKVVLGPNQGVMAVMNMTGDTKTIWDRTKPVEVEDARTQFDRFKAKGYMAYTVEGEGKKGTVISKFDPDAERIIFAPPMRGGC